MWDKILFFFGTSVKHFNGRGKLYLGEMVFVFAALLFAAHAFLFAIAYLLLPFAGFEPLDGKVIQLISQLLRAIIPIIWIVVCCSVANTHGIGWSWVNKDFQRENDRG